MLTITEALAEIKTLGKRVQQKSSFIQQYLARQDLVRDPLEKEGGSVEAIRAAAQSLADLTERVVVLRSAIHRANAATLLTINGTTRTLADWLVWRRDAVPMIQTHRGVIDRALTSLRQETVQRNIKMVTPAGQPTDRMDMLVNIDELAWAKAGEGMIDTLGQLDGQLSLKNATTTLDIQ